MLRHHAYGAFFLFAILAMSGGALGAFAVKDFAHARASHEWETVEGVILSASQSNGAASKAGPLRYAYFLNGRNYESDKSQFASARFMRAAPHYKAGERVRVYVAPGNPAEAVLAPGGSWITFATALGVASILVFIGLGGLVRSVAIAMRPTATPELV